MLKNSTDAKSKNESQASSTIGKLKKREIKRRNITTLRTNVDCKLYGRTKKKVLYKKK